MYYFLTFCKIQSSKNICFYFLLRFQNSVIISSLRSAPITIVQCRRVFCDAHHTANLPIAARDSTVRPSEPQSRAMPSARRKPRFGRRRRTEPGEAEGFISRSEANDFATQA